MAEDLTALSPPFATKVITLGGIDVATEVKLPIWSRRLSARFVGQAGKYANTGTDGAAIVADHQTVVKDCLHSFSTDHSGRAGLDRDVVSAFLASPVAGTVVRLTIEMGV